MQEINKIKFILINISLNGLNNMFNEIYFKLIYFELIAQIFYLFSLNKNYLSKILFVNTNQKLFVGLFIN